MICTNEVLTLNLKEFTKDPLCFGFAQIQKNNYCSIDFDGNLIKDNVKTKEWYDAKRTEYEQTKIAPFMQHLKRLFVNDPRDLDIFLNYMAFKMQYPGVKPRWAIVLAGEQGVGKDIAIDACWEAYGSNFINNVSPADILSGYNDYINCLILRISEVADLGESNKWAFNEKVKVLISGHPDRMQINPKYGAQYWVTLYNGTILTTNHLETGIYMPEDDRRYYVIKCATWGELNLDIAQRKEYFNNLFKWFTTPDSKGITGFEYIGEYLYWLRDVSNFECHVCPEPTEAKKSVQASSNMLPSSISEGIMSYISILETLNNDNASAYIKLPDLLLKYDFAYKPVLISMRVLKGILASNGQSENDSKINYYLNAMGYERLYQPTKSSKNANWRLRVPKGYDGKLSLISETLYYLPTIKLDYEDDAIKPEYTTEELADAVKNSLKEYLVAINNHVHIL